MYVLIVVLEGGSRTLTVHVVNEEGARVHSAPSVHGALSWLWLHGERQVVAYTDDGPELFLLEPCDHPAMVLPSLSLRRSHLGGCCHVPRLRGLDLAQPGCAEVREERHETQNQTRRRREATIRHATAHVVQDCPE